jgi:hypothetical protein
MQARAGYSAPIPTSLQDEPLRRRCPFRPSALFACTNKRPQMIILANKIYIYFKVLEIQAVRWYCKISDIQIVLQASRARFGLHTSINA